MRVLRIDDASPYRQLIGIGGLGTGIFFNLAGDHTLGRNESRVGELLSVRDYCKLHIVIHYVATLLGAPAGFQVRPVGRVGDDAPGQFVMNEMKNVGIDTRFVEIAYGRPTLFSVCYQYPDGTGGNITTSNSAAAALNASDLDVVRILLGPQTIALLLPEVSLELRRHLLDLACETQAFTAASFLLGEIQAARQLDMFRRLNLVSLNESEASELIGEEYLPDSPATFLARVVKYIQSSCPELSLVVSAGKQGAYAVNRQTWNYSPSPPLQVASTAGAGDCLLGSILAAIAAGIPLMNSLPPRRSLTERPLDTALEIGTLLASYKVTSPHTIHPNASLETLIEFAQRSGITIGSVIAAKFSTATDATRQTSLL